jgi:hypothetical protein
MSDIKHTCKGKIYNGFRFHTCGRNAAYEDEGLWFCKTHHPPTVKAKDNARFLKWQEEYNARAAKERKARDDKAEIERKAAMYDELLAALRAAALAIHEYRTQGAPHAYWDDIEAQAEAAIEKAIGANNDQG